MLQIAPSGDAGMATAAAGAMLGVLGEMTPGAPHERLQFELRRRAAARYPDWLCEIATLAHPPPLREGTFVVGGARSSDAAALDAIEATAAQHELPCERVDAGAVPALSPRDASSCRRALFLADEASVDARALHAAVRAAACSTGRVVRRDGRVVRLCERVGRITGIVLDDGETAEAAAVVLCAGAEVGRIVLETPSLREVNPPVIAAKGVGIRLRPPRGWARGAAVTHAIRTPNREFACGLHLLPGDDGVYLGSTNRTSRHARMTGEATAGELALLLNSASAELIADLGRWDVSDVLWGNRPLAADGLPMVGGVGLEGLLLATGTYRNGILLAPLVADLVYDELHGGDGDPRLSVGERREPVPGRNPAGVLADGLADFARLVRDSDDATWDWALEPLLRALGHMALANDEQADLMRRQVAGLLATYPSPEMVPEAIIELLVPEPPDDEPHGRPVT